MTTKSATSDVPNPSLNRAGNKRGMHPACRKNLNPAKPGEQRHKGNPYPITAQLRDLLRDPKVARNVAETMLLVAQLPNSKSYAPTLKELLDRTEGKVPGDQPIINNFIQIKEVEIRLSGNGS